MPALPMEAGSKMTNRTPTHRTAQPSLAQHSKQLAAITTPLVRATCENCSATVGAFHNKWHRLAGVRDYALPALSPAPGAVAGVTRSRGKSQQAQAFDQSLAGSELDQWCVLLPFPTPIRPRSPALARLVCCVSLRPRRDATNHITPLSNSNPRDYLSLAAFLMQLDR